MKITIRVLNPNKRAGPRPAPDVSPEPPKPEPKPRKKLFSSKPKDNGGNEPPAAVTEAAAAAVARELKRLQSIAEQAPAAARSTEPVRASPSSRQRASAEAPDASLQPDFGLEEEPGLSAIQSRFKILIVDDDPIIIRLLTHFLSKSNYDVKSVNEGMEGLKIAFAEKPDLILLDVMMPGMDGFRFLELLKKGKRFANVPVLMISALVDEDQVLRALEAGATDYIVKPFSSRIVLAKVHKALKDLL
ncbi:MAG: response regulator [Candidatus Aminicenantes bacterium]|nr:response regulator [Candidatus Aminicenantes bacterium]